IRAVYPGTAWTHTLTATNSLLVLPVAVRGVVLGAIAFGFRDEGPMDGNLMSVARTLAELTGQAWERAGLFEAEHNAAHELQRQLLPVIASSLPGVEVATRYLPGDRGHEVGGDWYDAFELPGDRLALVVGDVMGHDLDAAVVMSQLQNRLRSLAPHASDPADALVRLDEAYTEIAGPHYATVGIADYRPATGELRYASAGHCPPLLAVDGSVRYLEVPAEPPLGCWDGPRTSTSVTIGGEAALLLYTDGLVERRTASLDAGLDRLIALADQALASGGGSRPVEAMCDAVLADVSTGESVSDDIVVLCVRMTSAVAPDPSRPTIRSYRTGHGDDVFRATLRHVHDAAEVRWRMRRWARAAAVPQAICDDLVLGVNEALANALEHGRPRTGPHVVSLRVVSRAAGLEAEITDGGSWSPAVGLETRGRGTTMMVSTADRFRLAVTPGGTTVHLVFDHRRAGHEE
ncbi:MAG: ATP-binding SpoIIE family protein phosphatase, partial [Phycicoccus sp.]